MTLAPFLLIIYDIVKMGLQKILNVINSVSLKFRVFEMMAFDYRAIDEKVLNDGYPIFSYR
jgi:hypothetical protein